MSRTTRLAFVAVAAVLAIGAVVIWSSSRSDNEDTAPKEATVTETPATSPTKTTSSAPADAAPAEPKPEKPKPAVLRSGKVKKITVKKGDEVRLQARSPTDNEVHVHGYDILKDAPAGKTVKLSFPADIEGIFEVEFELTGEQIAELEVRP